MGRHTAALGLPAVIQSLEILAAGGGRSFTFRPGGVLLEPGSMWSGDTVLLSATPGSVRYAKGDALYAEDTPGFVAAAYSAGSKRTPMMSGLFDAPRGFALKMAPAMCLHWGPRGSVCAWLNSYGAFYCNNRPDIEVAGRYAGLLLEGLFALRARWPGLFTALTDAMGGPGSAFIGRWLNASESERFLGFLLATQGTQRISVDAMAPAITALRESPTPEFERCTALPMYARMVRRAEEASRELSPLVEKLRGRL